MVELVNTNNLGLFDREIVQVQVLFPLVDLFYINSASFIPWTPALSLPDPSMQACMQEHPLGSGVPGGGSGGIRQGFVVD